MSTETAGGSTPSASGNAPHRSTRGASKQRRDQINVEIQQMRDLLPLSESIKDRLFQLQVMSLACIFIRKHRYKPHVVSSLPSGDISSPTTSIDSAKALRGFLVMSTKSGKLLYISENASEYLGHSVEEIMCQGDSIFDLVDSRDHSAMQNELGSGPPERESFPEERVFICRMNLSRTAKRQLQFHKFVLIHGRYIHPNDYYQNPRLPPETIQPIFASYCQPLLNPENAESLASGNTNVFSSQHYLDMKFKEVDHMFLHHLGYTREQLLEKSWYGLIHPDYVTEVAYKHRLLCQEKEGSLLALIKLQTTSGEFIWVHTVFAVRSNFVPEMQEGRRVRHIIYATYQIISDVEATALQQNAWIYTMRHSYPPAFSCQDSPVSQNGERPITPASPFPVDPFCKIEPGMLMDPHSNLMLHGGFDPMMIKQEPGFMPMPLMQPPPFPMGCHQIKVEIPCKPPFPTMCMYTPDNSSPESSASFPSHFPQIPMYPHANQRSGIDSVNDLLRPDQRGPLPELGGDIDEFFKQVECASSSDASSQKSPPQPDVFPPMQHSLHAPPHHMDPHNFLSFMGRPFPFVSMPQEHQSRHPCHRHSIQYGYSEMPEYKPVVDPFLTRKRLGSWAGV